MLSTQHAACAEAQLSHEEALLVLKLAFPHGTDGLNGAQSARTIYNREKTTKRIITFSKDVDGILGGGIALGQVTEFCGVPGVGKTQLGMQLAINVHLPTVFHGVEGQAVYIDTEGSFTAERCKQMTEAFCKHLVSTANIKNDQARRDAAAALTPEVILSGIHLFRCRDAVEQLAVVEVLPSFLDAHPAVKLIVIDSVTFHFRQDYEDMAQRTRQLAQMAQSLMAIAGTRQVGVVLMNQVTTKLTGNEQSRLVPALGESWAHAATSRVILYWRGDSRYAYIYKSPSQPAAAGEYTVTAEGVRSVKRPAAVRHHAEAAGSIAGGPSAGRFT
jgi:RAD51-like protein 2